MNILTPFSISYSSDNSKHAAINFSKNYGFPCLPDKEVNTALNLNYTDEYVELRDNEKNTSIHIDFLTGELAHRQKFGGGRGQSIAKAIGLKQGMAPPTIIDATAGLAKDAYVLACLGCAMTLIERSPVVAELIKDAIHRAEEDEHFQTILANGFKVVTESSINYLSRLKTSAEKKYPDVIYLDPMFPERKKSASVKKNMQILQKLLGKDDDVQELLNIALQIANKRVVVKRPKGAPLISELKPDYTVETRKMRYDIYLSHHEAK